MNLISVIVPTYNAAKWVASAIDSVIAQTYQNLEIIIADDGSSDGTLDIVRKKLKVEFEGDWRVLELKCNEGPSVARNAALKTAKGEWVQFLDSDDRIAPRKLELEIEECANADGDVSVVYSPWRRCFMDSENITWDGPLSQPDMENRPPIMCLIGADRVLLGASLCRLSVLQKIGGFDASLRFWECEEINVRLAKSGRLKRLISSEPQYMWRMHREQAYLGGEKARYRLIPIAMSWIEQLLKAADGRPLGELGLSPEDRSLVLDSCTIWARRLYAQDREAFLQFLLMARALDPDLAPSKPAFVNWIARRVGYESAEAVARLSATPRALAGRALCKFGLRKKDSIFE